MNGGPDPSAEPAPIRPGHPTRRSLVGRLLLSAAGIDQDVLAEVPEERDRYMGIGGTVVGTAGVAAGSMALLVSTVLGVDGWLIALSSLLWGLLIFNLDRWLISSTHGVGRRRMLIPRVFLAIVLGIVVAEPLVLWAFRSAIEQEIATQQTVELAAKESDLRFCNPSDPTLTGERQADARCDELALNVAVPAATLQAIDALRQQLATAEGDRDLLRTQESDLVDRLQRERAGEGGGDTTGDYGDGPVAQALERDLDALRPRLDAAEQLVLARQQALQDALVASSATSGDFGQNMEAAISARLDEERAKFSDRPGLLERMEALGDLTGRHSDLMSARLFLTLFIVALDCMPVLAKAMSGKTTYDGLLQARLAARERAGKSSLTAEGDEWSAEIALRTFGQEQRRMVAKRRIEVDRDKQLLLLDTEQRADRAQHGGSDAAISDVLFEDGPVGPMFSLSWEQPPDDQGRPWQFWRTRRVDERSGFGGHRSPRREGSRPSSSTVRGPAGPRDDDILFDPEGLDWVRFDPPRVDPDQFDLGDDGYLGGDGDDGDDGYLGGDGYEDDDGFAGSRQDDGFDDSRVEAAQAGNGRYEFGRLRADDRSDRSRPAQERSARAAWNPEEGDPEDRSAAAADQANEVGLVDDGVDVESDAPWGAEANERGWFDDLTRLGDDEVLGRVT